MIFLSTFLMILATILPQPVVPTYGTRLVSKDGAWVLPTASRLLGSTDDDHVGRGSINSWDLSTAVGSPVFAARQGRVIYADCYGYERKIVSNKQGYGCAVEIDHGNGIHSQYGHCKEGTLYVRKDETVTPDSLLCQVGLTGVTGWPHTHFTILKDGAPVRIDSIFDINQMQYCKFCQSNNDPKAPIQGVRPSIGQGGSYRPVGLSRMSVLLTLGTLTPTARVYLIFGVILGLGLGIWLSSGLVRTALVSTACSLITTFAVIWLFSIDAPSSQPMPTGKTWEAVYPIIQSNEGWEGECVFDPIKTKYGVTYLTYNRWLAMHGRPNADVCDNITLDQAKMVFYEFYWIPSGAYKMEPRMALTVVDHYINTGSVSAGLNQCGTDVACFNRWRDQDYRSMRNFSKYGQAYINRVNRIRKYSGG